MRQEFEKGDGEEPSSAAGVERARLFFTCGRVLAYPNRHETVVRVSDICSGRVGGASLPHGQVEFSNELHRNVERDQ